MSAVPRLWALSWKEFCVRQGGVGKCVARRLAWLARRFSRRFQHCATNDLVCAERGWGRVHKPMFFAFDRAKLQKNTQFYILLYRFFRSKSSLPSLNSPFSHLFAPFFRISYPKTHLLCKKKRIICPCGNKSRNLQRKQKQTTINSYDYDDKRRHPVVG